MRCQRGRQGRLARRFSTQYGDAQQGQAHFKTIVSGAAGADFFQARQPAAAIKTKMPYSTAVSGKPLWMYKATYRMSTTIQTIQFSSFLRDNRNCPTRLPAVRKPSALGTSVSVEVSSQAIRAKPMAQAIMLASQPRPVKTVTGSTGAPLSGCSHWYQPQNETLINTSCKTMSPYRRESKKTKP